MVAPFVVLVPGAIDCCFTFPAPIRFTFSPSSSNKYMASRAPIPMTLGTNPCLIEELL